MHRNQQNVPQIDRAVTDSADPYGSRCHLPSITVRNLPVKPNEDITEETEIIKKTCRNLIRAKKQKMEKADGLFDMDILSAALQSGAFTEDELVNQLMTLLAAGHETTSMAVTWAVHLLCQHLQVQTHMREDVGDFLSASP
jgi:cytochrome P450